MPWTKPYKPVSNQPLDLELYEQSGRITFITIHAYNRLNPFVNDPINQMVIRRLHSEQTRLNCRVFVYCLMPDHLHFLISPNQDGVSILTFTNQFKGKTTNLSWDLGWQGKLWQPRFYDHIVRADENLRAIAEYIIANPVRKDLVSTPEDWPWSGSFSPIPV
jgi:REP element-mobilizing transposase RayT